MRHFFTFVAALFVTLFSVNASAAVYTPEATDGATEVFFEADASVASVAIWVWNDNYNFSCDKASANWDEKPNMEEMGTNEDATKKIFKWTYTGTEKSTPEYVIFVPAGGSQTTTYAFANHGYYTSDGKQYVVGETYEPALESESEISVFCEVASTVSSVGIHVWNAAKEVYTDATFGNTKMDLKGTNAEGRNIFKWTYTGDKTELPVGVIFIPAGGSQSADLEYKNHGYYIDNVWDHEVSDIIIPTGPKYYAYFISDQDWTVCKAYTWGGTAGSAAWPGDDCTLEDANYTRKDGVAGTFKLWKWEYKGDADGAPTNIQFNNGTNQKQYEADFVNGNHYDVNGITTGVEDVKVAEGAVKVAAANGEINVIGADDVMIYNAAGVLVSDDARATVVPGMYIVKAGNQVQKVIVK